MPTNNNKVLIGLLITLILGAYGFSYTVTYNMSKALADNIIANDRLRASEDQRLELNHSNDMKELGKQLLRIEKTIARIDSKLGNKDVNQEN